MTSGTEPVRAPHRRMRRVGLTVTVCGLAILAVAAAVVLSWRGDLPDPVATHWGAQGSPDGFMSLGAFLWGGFGLGALLVLGFGAVTTLWGQSAVSRRIGAATTIWVALFLALVQLGALHVQRGLADASGAGEIGGALTLAIVGSLVPAVLVGVLLPGDPPQPADTPVAPEASRVPLAASERAVWIGHTDAGAGIAMGAVAIVVLVTLTVVSGVWGLLIVAALLVGVFVAMFAFTVRVDESGLLVRSSAGWPRTHVPLDEVLRASVVQVRPLREFGGWGWRVGRGGRVGIVLRAGEGLLVERTGGRSIVVTVADAGTAAALLNTLADRQRPAR
ncbi:DUF1648 domain-containing protein [Micromonospora sp. NPDC000316]|uniref:DUF1648 domain-containing protein n=1 Tax=Micromonospora sp. NPDC000316 TaxID=3364216 RepID=UPI0036CF1DB4